jgi:pimeloyl-ACP methyl ester carboxylesterase
MTPLRKLQPFTLPLTVGGTRIDIAGLRRDGTGEPLLFLHGFGSTKEDYADIIHQHDLADRPILAYDAPGCGASTCSDLSALSIPLLVSVATEVLDAQRIERYHLIGHSMGGLTALMLADQNPTRVASFVNIEGNIAPGRLLPEPTSNQLRPRRPPRVPHTVRRPGRQVPLLRQQPLRRVPAP